MNNFAQSTFELTSDEGVVKLKNAQAYADRYLILELHNSNGMVKAVDLSLADLEKALKRHQKSAEISSTWKDDMMHKATLAMIENGSKIQMTLHEQTSSSDGYRETEYSVVSFERHDFLELLERYKMANPYRPLKSAEELARWDKDW